MKGSRNVTRSEKKLFLITGFALIFIIAFGAWRQYVEWIPDVEFPTPKMPSPNAYDYYTKAGAAIVKANPSVDPIHDLTTVPKTQWKKRYPTVAKEVWLRSNAVSLRLLRLGFNYPYRVRPQRSGTQESSRHRANLRHMARMSAVESHAHSERGNYSAAAKSALDITKLGHDVSHGGGLIEYQMGVSFNSISRRELWKILPHLKSSEAKMAASRLRKLVESRVSFADVLRKEKIDGQTGLAESMRSGSWKALTWGRETGLGKLTDELKLFNTPRRTIFNNYTRYMELLISEAEQPYRPKDDVPPVYDDDYYNQVIMPIFKRTRMNHSRDAAGDDLFFVSLALRAYLLDNRRYPLTLTQLVPNYLKKIPADPYGKGEPLRYKLVGKGYTLYSIGPDGTDNKGTPIEDKSKTGGYRYLVWDGKGDFVAGINY